jgi:hypothetical protein
MPVEITSRLRRAATLTALAAAMVPAGAHAAPHAELHLYGERIDAAGVHLVDGNSAQQAGGYYTEFRAGQSTADAGRTLTSYALTASADADPAKTLSGTFAQPTFGFILPATWFDQPVTARLTVKDSSGATDSTSIRWMLVHRPELTIVAPRGYIFAPGDVAIFDAGASSPAGAVETFEWSTDDGTTWTAPSSTARFQFRPRATTTLKLRATGQDGGQAVRSVTAIVHERPAIDLKVNPERPQPGHQAELDASGSTAAPLLEGRPTLDSYEWDLDGDGSYELDTGRTATAAVTFATAGGHEIGVRVTDSAGTSATLRRTIQVGSVAQAPAAPLARLAIVGSPSRVRGGITIQVRCPGAATRRCRGVVTVRRNGLVIGESRYSVGAGRTATVKVTTVRLAAGTRVSAAATGRDSAGHPLAAGSRSAVLRG